MKKYLETPDLTLYEGIEVTKDTNIEFKNDHVEQEIKDLKLHTIAKQSAEWGESTIESVINLQEGDIVLYEKDLRGYFKPVQKMMTPKEVIEDLKVLEE